MKMDSIPHIEKLATVSPKEAGASSVRNATAAIPTLTPKDAIAPSKSQTSLQTAPVVAATLRDPSAPTVAQKIKADTLAPPQRARLTQLLEKISNGRATAVLASLASHDEALREPSILAFPGKNGGMERWLIGATVRTGSFGKFRVAINLNPTGETPEVMAVKEYRLEERRPLEAAQTVPSSSKVARAKKILEKVAIERPDVRRIIKTLISALPLVNHADIHRVYLRDVKKLCVNLVERGHTLSQDEQSTLIFERRTGYITPEAVAEENKLFPLAQSPLEVKHSVEGNGRVYNFSGLMTGETFDVAVGELGSQRQPLGRMVALQALQSLAKMHDAGIIHRDVKLENIFLDREGVAHMGDWGFAIQPTPGTPPTQKCGSPQYVAPEVISGKPYDAAVDIYSLGQSIFGLSSGTLLFQDFNRVRFKGTGTTQQHLALDHIIEKLPFTEEGTLNHADVRAMRQTLWENPRTDAAVPRKLVDGMISSIIELHAKDPLVCEVLLNHMLRFDPKRRLGVHALIPEFEKLQPTDPHSRADAKTMALERMNAEVSVEDELAVLYCYGQVYGFNR